MKQEQVDTQMKPEIKAPVNTPGFSLVETIIAVALAATIMSTMWMVFSANNRRSAKTTDKLDGLKGAMSLIQRFEYDLNRIYLNSEHPLTITSKGEKKIEFYVYSPKTSNLQEHIINTQKVQYFLSQKRHGIYRQINDGKKKRLRGYYEDWLINRKDNPLPVIDYLITTVSPGFFNKPQKKRKATERVTFQGAILLQAVNNKNQYPYWHKVPIGTED